MVFLIGCDHVSAQTYPEGSKLDDPSNKTQCEFKNLLIIAIEKYRPLLIAEEHHPEFLKKRRQCSIAFEVASEKNICHKFCDPSLDDRERLGISDGPPHAPPGWDNHKKMQDYFLHEWPIREEFWISKMVEDVHRRILFIFGAGHRETLRRRFESRAIQTRIVEKKLWSFEYLEWRFSRVQGCISRTSPKRLWGNILILLCNSLLAQFYFVAFMLHSFRDRTRPLPARRWA
ncbi:MAG: hypothetical protein ABR923_02775 [Terracidiphilus sp.]